MGETVVVSLGGDVVGQCGVGDTRRSKRVHLDRRVSHSAKVSGRKGSNTSAEAVAYDHQFVVGVGGNSLVEDLGNGVFDKCPGVPEAHFRFTAITEARVSVGEVDVGEPVPNGVGAAEGQDNCLVGVV